MEILTKYLYETLLKAGGVLEPGTPIIKSSYNVEKKFVFLELRSVEETITMLQLDGIRFLDSSLRLRRPPDFDKNPFITPKRNIPKIDPLSLGIISTKVEESPTKLFVGGIPKEFSEV